MTSTVEGYDWSREFSDEPPPDAGLINEDGMLAEQTRRELRNLRARRSAAELFAAENRQRIVLPSSVRLDALLGEEDEPTQWRIQDLWPRHGHVVFAAQAKSGKTTTINNLIRCLADGDRFLGIYPVDPVRDGSIVVTDLEMPRSKLREWLGKQAITNTELVHLWSLRGQAAVFDLLDDATRALWVEQLAEVQARTWIVDCLGPVLSALGYSENENRDVGQVLDALTTTAAAAGVDEVLLVHHMGHGAERSRGASRLRDWPDAEWRLVRQKSDDNPFGDPDPDAPRFFSAFGRDVDVKEGQLIFDPDTHRLVYADGTRRQAKATAALRLVLEFVRDHPGVNVRAVQDATGDGSCGVSRDGARDALKTAVARGFVATAPGPSRSTLHTLTAAGFGVLATELTQ